MAVSIKNGPDIVTDGLIMCLDSNDYRPWDAGGDGTLWRDSVQNILFSATGLIPVHPNYRGPFDISGVTTYGIPFIDVYWVSSIADAMKVDLRNDFTFTVWFYIPSVAQIGFGPPNPGCIISKDYISDPGMGELYVEGGGSFPPLLYRTGDVAGMEFFPLDQWNQLSFRLTIRNDVVEDTQTGEYSVNGGGFTSNFIQTIYIDVPQGNAFQIGNSEYGNQLFDRQGIGLILFYNRLISDAEDAQNFNAFRARFNV